MGIEEYLKGRKLLKEEIPQMYHDALESSNIKKQKGMIVSGNQVICQRCLSKSTTSQSCISQKKHSFYYCDQCILLGRIESRKTLYSMKEKKRKPRAVVFSWEGTLTKSQKQLSCCLLKAYKKHQHFLVHAVTGAGKTEMLFPLIHYALKQGSRVAVVSPRVDVCLELFPRFQEAFNQEEMVLLYGKQNEPYCYTSFVVATTHQLLRFEEAFDLIVVDEVDAFPYAGNQMLENGVKKALKKRSVLVYLTATPSQNLLQQVEKKELMTESLSKRYHQHSLPVPVCYFDFFLKKKLSKGKLPKVLESLLREQKRQCLIFLPNIERMKRCFKLMSQQFPEKKIAYVHASKEDREELILSMRKGKIDWLLSTTILERGVTFPNIDVIVLEAEHPVFNTASLVQIAGRVGRKADYPTGQVSFIHQGKTRHMNQAIKQINEMNQKAGFK